jgi:DNA-binding transcriptional ArsR family regulator
LNGRTVSSVLSNGTRASILYLLANSPDTLYSMQVQEIASATKTAQRMVIYHLERLRKTGLVEVKKSRKYGARERRSIWGLNMRNAELVERCCDLLENFLDKKELAMLTSGNIMGSRRASKSRKLARPRAML